MKKEMKGQEFPVGCNEEKVRRIIAHYEEQTEEEAVAEDKAAAPRMERGMRTAVYPGSFDPITNGHIDLVERALCIFDRLIVAVAIHRDKSTLFSIEERVEMVKEATEKYDRLTVDNISGLTVDYVRDQGASVIVRGLRAISDFELELQMALMNRKLNREIETVFLMPSIQYSYIRSSIIKEVASVGGCLDGLVPETTIRRLKEKFS
jgi:pantetheine-phosphate adenylyltransferase